VTSRTPFAQTAALVGWLALTAITAAAGTIASLDAASFYAQLARPSWAPPAGAFGPVWSVLYLLMAIAAWLVWREPPSSQRTYALTLFVVQLVLNALWSWLFFAWHLGALSLVDVLALLVLIVAMLTAFWRTRPLAGVLIVPYLAWVAFASELTFVVWRANPSLLG
jgi:tryptophan-rich sensory protein